MNSEKNERVAQGLLEAEKVLLGMPREIVRKLHFLQDDDGVLIFEADRAVARKVSPKLLRVLQNTLSEAWGNPVQIRIHPKGTRTLEEEFYLDSSNQAVHLLFEGLAKDPRPLVEGMNPIVIHGPRGAGKTFFLRRFMEALEHPVTFWNATDLASQIVHRIYKGGLENFCRMLIESRMLIVDEAHRLRSKHRCQQELAKIMDEMRSRGNLVLLASRHHPMQILEFKQSLASRFLGGFVLELAPPQKKTQLKVLSDHGVCGKAAEALLEGIPENPSIGRILEEIAKAPKAGLGEVTESSAESFRRPFEMGGWDLEKLRDRVLEEFGVSHEEFSARHQPRHVSTARQVVAYLYRKGGINSSQTARYLGWFSSSSVLHAVHRVEERMAKDEQFRKAVEECMHG